jgi:hypothetical protein
LVVDNGDWISVQSGNDNCKGSVIPVSGDMDGFTGGDSGATGNSKSWECFHWESRVGGGTALDELGGDGPDLVDTERGIECSRDGITLVGTEDVGIVTSLDREN